MRTALTISAALHVAFGVALALSNQDALATRIEEPVVVEIASPSEVPEAITAPMESAAKPSDKPAESAAGEAAPPTPPKPPAADAKPVAPEKPVKPERKPAAKTQQAQPTPPPANEPAKESTKESAKESAKPRVEASAAPAPAPPPPPNEAQPVEPQQQAEQPQQPWGSWLDTAYTAMATAAGHGLDTAETSAKISPAEIAAFKARLQECWHPPAGLASDLKVVLRVAFKRNGALSAEPAILGGSASSDGPLLVQTARQALQQCQPYGLFSAANYKEWKVLDLGFSPRGLTSLPRI